MMFLKIEFSNARLFTNFEKSKDQVHTSRKKNDVGTTLRTSIIPFKEPITKYQVRNMIRALFGYKTIRTHHKMHNYVEPTEITEKICNIADNSYLRYTNIPIQEKSQIKKSLANAWDKRAIMNWHKFGVVVKNEFETEVFNLFKEILNVDGDLKKLYPIFDDMVIALNVASDEQKERANQIFRKNKVTSLYSYIFGSGNLKLQINANLLPEYRRCVYKGVDDVKVYCGEIYCPVSQDDIDYLNKYSSGVCTILDDGVVRITDIVHDVYNIDQFQLVGEISTEKVNTKK